MSKLTMRQSFVALLATALVFFGVGLIALSVSGSTSDSAELNEPDFERVEELLTRENVDQDVQDFIVVEYFGYSEQTRDQNELQDVIKMSAVVGFVRSSFQNENYEALEPLLRPIDSDITITQYEVAVGENTYFLSIGISDQEKTEVFYLDDERTGGDFFENYNKSDLGFERIQNLTLN